MTEEPPGEQILRSKNVAEPSLPSPDPKIPPSLDLAERAATATSFEDLARLLVDQPNINLKEVEDNQAILVETETGELIAITPQPQEEIDISPQKPNARRYTIESARFEEVFGKAKIPDVAIGGSSAGPNTPIISGGISQGLKLEFSVPRENLGYIIFNSLRGGNLVVMTGPVSRAGIVDLRKEPNAVSIFLQAQGDREPAPAITLKWGPYEWKTIAARGNPPLTEKDIKQTALDMNALRGYHIGPGENRERVITKNGSPIRNGRTVGEIVQFYLNDFEQRGKDFALKRAAALVWWTERLDTKAPPI